MSIVVDAHVHIFPPDICMRRETHLERDVWFGELYANPKALLVTAEDLIASMDAAGIDHSIACGFPWRDQGLCREHNEYLDEAAKRFPDRISWLATTVPNDQRREPQPQRNAPPEVGRTRGNSANAPGHGGSAPGNSANAPGNSANAPGNSANAPGQNRESVNPQDRADQATPPANNNPDNRTKKFDEKADKVKTDR